MQSSQHMVRRGHCISQTTPSAAHQSSSASFSARRARNAELSIIWAASSYIISISRSTMKVCKSPSYKESADKFLSV